MNMTKKTETLETDITWIKDALKNNKDDHKAIMDKFESGAGKISSNGTAIGYLKWAVGICYGLIGTLLAYINVRLEDDLNG